MSKQLNNVNKKNYKIELPDEIWNYIKDFVFDWKRSHKQKLHKVLFTFPNFCWKMKPIYKCWGVFPPLQNTNDIIRDEYYGVLAGPFTPPPNLVLTSICYNLQGNEGWWCGYGWEKVYCL